ncbi:hypothetical protein NKF89_02360 [Agathobacter rectalis]|uniref:hypothetical protein n=1 Tax=Agathobacter rectalis TaxID=39491 RepID=UPI0021FDF1BF|nr:hypothetical protein [Agathobacter rectalis]UTB43147.1 hypothetical protein NKF89_02360 [Agathobacter rectalis]
MILMDFSYFFLLFSDFLGWFGVLFGNFCGFSYFFPALFRILAGFGVLFCRFLRFQLLFSALFRILGWVWGAVWGISAVSAPQGPLAMLPIYGYCTL